MSQEIQVKLIDGTLAPLSRIEFDRGTNRFYYNGSDITTNMYLRDMQVFSGFDLQRHNQWLSDQKQIRDGNTPQPNNQSTSTIGIFTEQILTDPFAAPLEAADRLADDLVGNKLFQLAAVGLGVGLLIYFIAKAK